MRDQRHTMDLGDLIARVYPNSDKDHMQYAATAIEGSSFYVRPLYPKPKQKVRYGRDDRETTEPPEEPGDIRASVFDGKPCIEIRFSKVPRSSHGILFGCSNKCDVILPDVKGPSNYHFSLTFDDQNRFIVKDLDSSIGTEVTYNNEGKGTRRKFNWIVGGDKNTHRQENIIIKIHDHVQFQVVAAEYDITCQSYIENVERFRQGIATAEGLLDDLDIFRPKTELPTGAHTPGEGSIYVKRTIGQGGFGVAIHCWNVSTGAETVTKRPSTEVIKEVTKNDRDWKRWKEEAENMRKLTHSHIVKLLNVTYDPYPELQLEYVPGGPLSKLKNITVPESVFVLSQCLSALEYMHAGQLAHRDISPDNILVRSREPFHVILADFGLSKNAAELRTRCGTTPYAAPEIFEDSNVKRYSAAVDIWSLGVVTCKILRILPSYSEHMERVEQNNTKMSWCNMVVDSLGQLYRRRPDRLKGLLLASMLVISPEGRNSARGCYQLVKELPDLIVNNEACDRISDVLWRQASVVYSSDTNADEQPTIRLQKALVADAGETNNDAQSTDEISPADLSSSDDETRRRSAAPPPSSRRLEAKSTLKRPTTVIAPESPTLKRRGRVSISQSHCHPAMLDKEVDQETAELAALLEDLKNAKYRYDHLRDPSSADISSWHPWDPFEKKTLHWTSSRGWVHRDNLSTGSPIEKSRFSLNELTKSGHSDHTALGTVPTDGDNTNQFCSLNCHEEQMWPERTTEHLNPTLLQGKAVPLTAAERATAKQPSAWVNGSHMSTQEVLDRGEIVYMVIRHQAVEMRKSTCQLNACQIPRIAGREAEQFLKVLRKNTHVQQGRTRCELWVPFEDGVFLAQKLDVVDELQPLLDFAERPMPPPPPPEENYFFYPRNTTAKDVPPGFKIPRYKDHPILYQPSNKQLNATQLVKANGRQRFYLREFWRRHGDIDRFIRRGHALVQGTYIHLEDATVLWKAPMLPERTPTSVLGRSLTNNSARY